jgi:hypothetical protein
VLSVASRKDYAPIGEGLHKWSGSMAKRPHPEQEYFIAEILSLHMCVELTSSAPQKLHFDLSPQGLHK